MQKNKISIVDFFQLKNIEDNENELEIQLLQAFYKVNLKSLEKIMQLILNSNSNEYLKLLTVLLKALSQNRIKNLNQDIRNRINDIFFENSEWQKDWRILQLFGASILCLDFQNIRQHFWKLWSEYNGNLNSKSLCIQRLVAACSINFLKASYENGDLKDSNLAFGLLNELASVPELEVFKIIRNYYVFLFEGNNTRCTKIKNFLFENELESIINKYIEINL